MKAHGIIVAPHTPLTPAGEIHEEAPRDHLNARPDRDSE